MEILPVLPDLLSAQLYLIHLAKKTVDIALVELIVVFQFLDEVFDLGLAFESFFLPPEDLECDSVEYLLA